MKFSTQEEYGVRCLLQIARAGEGEALTIPEISQAEGLSEATVGKLLRLLRIGGFILSERGRDGGYTLARDPSEIILGNVLAALGERIIGDDFCEKHSGVKSFCVHTVDCTVFSLWERVPSAVDNILFSTTLRDLLPGGSPATVEVTGVSGHR